MTAFPVWLHLLAIASLVVAALSAVVIVVDETRRPQRMAVMYAVWPLTALFGGLVWLFAYFRHGRGAPRGGPPAAHAHCGSGDEPSMPIAVFKGTSHCGAGCTLGDIVVEWGAFLVPAVATWFGYGTLFAERTFAIWIPDLIVAFLFGIAFQYYAIKPMRDLSAGQALVQAVKADAMSILSWQVGMYGAMALIQFGLFKPLFGRIAPVDSAEFWFAMQIAMLAGFAVAYPVNWWLVRAGIKERM